MPHIRTVLGDIPDAELGITLCHEHLLIDLKRIFVDPCDDASREMAHRPVTIENLGWIQTNYTRNLDNLGLYDESLVIEEARLFKQAGGSAIVEVTPVDIGRNPASLVRISEATGLHVVMGCGYYVHGTHPADMATRSEDQIFDEMVADVREGAGGTRVRAGIIGEIGCTWPLHERERKVLRAAGRAQRETGAALTIHPGRDPAAPFEILDVVAGAGGDPARVIMGHLDRTYPRFDKLQELAQRGCYMEFDMFGIELSYYPFGKTDLPNDGRRIDLIKRLIEAGYLERMLLSHDIAFKHTLVRYGGRGYGHILQNVRPKMADKGLSEGEIRTMLVDNPRRALAIA
ncbi:MAG: phosphotriesterase-related protein [Alphaproteobacteria bacterium]|nr:phosphotriesterase-related protein [Alphaproteobacteria bacterium]